MICELFITYTTVYYLLNQSKEEQDINCVTELHPAIMARSDRDLDADLVNQSETDDDMLYRLATPTDNPEEGDNLSDEIENDDIVNLFQANKSKAKFTNSGKRVGKFRRNAIGRQALSVTKMEKMRKTGGKDQNGKENRRNDFSRSVSPGIHLDNTSGEENRMSYPSSHYRRGNDDTVAEMDPNPLPQSGGARGNFSDHFPRNERLSRARGSELTEESAIVTETTNLKQSSRATRDNLSGGRQQKTLTLAI